LLITTRHTDERKEQGLAPGIMGGGSPLSGKISKYNGNYRKNENNFPEPENIFFQIIYSWNTKN
jgi:hypothetical protein